MDRVTFGIINCNRLHYLRSCFESAWDTTSEYLDREFIVVDNASVEEGTEEYLLVLEKRGVKVIRMKERDPSNEFARGLNTVFENATGDFILPLQGDMQFTVQGWLGQFVDFYKANLDHTGCISLDAQRRITHDSHARSMTQFFGDGQIKFCYDLDRPPFNGAGDVMYARKWIEKFYPWNTKNENHEGTLDSETYMLQKIKEIRSREGLEIYCAVPSIPVSIAIYTDSRGTNARVRGNKRYGDYWPPKEEYRYYKIRSVQETIDISKKFPSSIEDVADPIGWKSPLNSNGQWMKNPIRPENATPSDFVEL